MKDNYRNRMHRKIRRMNAGLGPEDETINQAKWTGILRNDPSYIGKWIELDLMEKEES